MGRTFRQNSNGEDIMTSKKNMTTNRKPRRTHRNKGGRKKGKKPIVGYYFDGKKSHTLYEDHWSIKDE